MHSCKIELSPLMLRVIYPYLNPVTRFWTRPIFHPHGYVPTRPPGQSTRQCPARCPLWHFGSRCRWILNVYIFPSAEKAETPLVNDIFIGIWRLSERFHFFQVPAKCPLSSSNNQSSEGRWG